MDGWMDGRNAACGIEAGGKKRTRDHKSSRTPKTKLRYESRTLHLGQAGTSLKKTSRENEEKTPPPTRPPQLGVRFRSHPLTTSLFVTNFFGVLVFYCCCCCCCCFLVSFAFASLLFGKLKFLNARLSQHLTMYAVVCFRA